MAARVRLLERIRLLAKGPTKVEPPREEAVVKSLTDHLSALLSSRPLNSISAESFGLPDLLAFGGEVGPEGLRDLEKALTETIKKYEPRLKDPKVTCLPQPEDLTRLAFALEGVLGGDGPQEIFLTAYLGADGQIRVVR
ncbi:MAG: type VI secretion system baseplate subunit TssE [Deltaproteobacteria bacterium]|jgi:type VI secretion system protein|nr:type VI secretion system baseplate subunit TssE [Deltaproteobacteria bacterium]